MLRKYIKELDAKADHKHACDYTLEQLMDALRKFRNPLVMKAAWLILSIGLRHEDLAELCGKNMYWTTIETVMVDVNFAKQRRTRSETTVIHLPTSWLPAFVLTQESFATGKRLVCPHTTTQLVNEELQRTLPQATTYSLRRNFIHRVLEKTKSQETNVYDFKTACKYTLHFDEKSLKAYYQKKAADYNAGPSGMI